MRYLLPAPEAEGIDPGDLQPLPGYRLHLDADGCRFRRYLAFLPA